MTSSPLKNRFRAESGAIFIRWAIVFCIILGLLLAFYMGGVAGRGEYKRIIGFVAVALGIVMCLSLKTKIWLLIPATWFLGGSVGGINLPFGLNELVVMGVFGMFMVFYALKVPVRKATYTSLDKIMFLNLAWLVTVYARNPAGVAALGSDIVGARPYFTILIACVTYWIFTHVILDAKTMKMFPRLLCGGSFITAVLGVLTRYVPSTALMIAPIYSGVSLQSILDQDPGGTDVDKGDMYRLNETGGLATVVHLLLCSMFRPLTLLTPARIIPFLLFIGSWLGILLSGYRSSIFQHGFYFVLASYFYAGGRDVVRSFFLALLALCVLLLGQGNIFDLPIPAQRALSFLPANWTSQVALDDAAGSTEWRFNIWRSVWKDNKYIKNKLLGDGFGFSKRDLSIQIDALLGGKGYIGGNEAETQMITGAFHSGPLSAIRVVGIIGLVFYAIFMIMSAQFAWKLIRRAKGTIFFGICLFVGMPLIYKPFDYFFIFGGFDSSLPFSIFQVGLLRLVDSSLTEHLEAQPLPVEPEIAPVRQVGFPRPMVTATRP